MKTLIQNLVTATPGILEWGALPLQSYSRKETLQQWVEKGYHGEMGFMERHLALREHPQNLEPPAKTALLFLMEYPEPLQDRSGSLFKIAGYARGKDYHGESYDFLKNLQEALQRQIAQPLFFRPFVDSSPVFERDLAVAAGLGWSGKNCMTLHREWGSETFILGCLVNFDLEHVHPQKSYCGTCQSCLTRCPTGAFVAPGVLDARKCISYWTIEYKGEIPREMADQLGGWIFGCDICQTVCPWNSSELPKAIDPKFDRNGESWLQLLRKGGGFKSEFKGTPLMRAGRRSLLRNVLIAIRNSGQKELVPLIKEIRSEESGYLVREIDTTLNILGENT